MNKETQRKERSDKRIRVNLSIDKNTDEKLQMLATACNKPKTTLASEIIKMAVNHLDIIDYYQTKYCTNDKYRVVPIRQNGEIHYS
ncbi:hypothetical protein [Pontibacillus halophilus]|uniref:hypothetical protein n=1 Tax=Pontibacillus halophilus TaxID=516704 RepID=UPI000402F664|nr:hypothetical protein [Pontibacillus halophilus]